MTKQTHFALATAFVLSLCLSVNAGEPPAGFKTGTPDLKSAGPLAFGPGGVLFVGDAQGAAVFAIDTGDTSAANSHGTFQIEGINAKLAALLGTTAREIQINDIAVNPASGKAYLSITRGQGSEAAPAIVRADRSGKLEAVAMDNIAFAKTELPNPPAAKATGRGASPRSESITDLAYVDGKLFVAGLSNEEFSSRFLSIPFPFKDSAEETSVEIYHGSHAQLETKSPIRTFVPFIVKGEPYLMAAYTCTPLVKVPVAALKPGAHVKGITVAELGNHNKPLDMIVYKKDGKNYLLMANSARGVMKVAVDGAASAKPITHKVSDKEGLPYETIANLKGVFQLDKLSDTEALVLMQAPGGSFNLQSIDLP